MFPHEARLRNLTYAAPLYVDVVMNEYRVARDVNVGHAATKHPRDAMIG